MWFLCTCTFVAWIGTSRRRHTGKVLGYTHCRPCGNLFLLKLMSASASSQPAMGTVPSYNVHILAHAVASAHQICIIWHVIWHIAATHGSTSLSLYINAKSYCFGWAYDMSLGQDRCTMRTLKLVRRLSCKFGTCCRKHCCSYSNWCINWRGIPNDSLSLCSHALIIVWCADCNNCPCKHSIRYMLWQLCTCSLTSLQTTQEEKQCIHFSL